MFLHASNASKDHDAIIIRSPDTDVAVLGITLNHAIPAKLYLDIGSKNQRRLLNLGEIASSLGEMRAGALLGFHAFTGCDAVSSFYGKDACGCDKCVNQMEESDFSDDGGQESDEEEEAL
ncbi:hypothetical protein HOLleu_36701 [Holothuria leucospilota]|uniref:Uncharacterized protein n=1 Tax=Holothuria leucospilota TaxID=206669 RepID=A0A9Q0YP13_HOLLE|nr:hypothetical protein HOLleu_36701 [Holothuria leucospilota]